ncbi:MAG: hypothetical protein FD180_861 [Planctomycetota bacterium]|nr:MAG: hypothetical protein FD180_861 [Planctomycetota bacterium]
MKRFPPTLAFLTFLASLASADMLLLKNRSVVEGRFVEKSADSVTLENFDGNVTVKFADIQKWTKEKGAFEVYGEKLAKLKGSDADATYALSKWCRDRRLWAQAKPLLEKTLELKPGQKAATKDLELVKKGLDEAWKASLVPLTVLIGIKQDLTKDEIEKLSEEVKAAGEKCAAATHGAMYFAEIVLSDQKAEGHLVYDSDFTGTPNGRWCIPMGTRNWFARVIFHELGHALLDLDDEYKGAGYGANTGES